MTRIFVSRQAHEDAYGLWSYIAEDNPEAAHRWENLLNDSYALLAQHPRLGPARPDLGTDLRFFPMGSYVIFYREVSEGLEIVRVLHGSRNLEAIFHADE
jgi:toxin ParE1/3/4